MNFEKQVLVPAPVDEAWEVLMDIPTVGLCLPGVKSVQALDDDRYEGAMSVKVGMISVSFQGTIDVTERDAEAHRAAMRVQGDDRRVGSSVNATIEMSLTPAEGGSELTVKSDAAVFGKLGELGQAVMLKKADQIMTEFAANLASTLESSGAGPDAPEPEAHVAPPAAEPARRSLLDRLRAFLRLGPRS
jgi:carbon monoxide dehydrogenase subunit G